MAELLQRTSPGPSPLRPGLSRGVAWEWVNKYFTREFVRSGGRPESIPDAPEAARTFLIRLLRLFGYKPSEEQLKSRLRAWRGDRAVRESAIGLAKSVTPEFDKLLKDVPKRIGLGSFALSSG